MKEIPLTKGYVALVDDADFEAVSAHKWCAAVRGKRVYAVQNKPLFLHQFLVPNAEKVDHRDGNGLNNQRNNIRPATNRQNCQAKREKRVGASSRFRGVSRDSRSGKWRSSITVDGKCKSLGYFGKESDAARAYDIAAIKYFGEFAAPNFNPPHNRHHVTFRHVQ